MMQPCSSTNGDCVRGDDQQWQLDDAGASDTFASGSRNDSTQYRGPVSVADPSISV